MWRTHLFLLVLPLGVSSTTNVSMVPHSNAPPALNACMQAILALGWRASCEASTCSYDNIMCAYSMAVNEINANNSILPHTTIGTRSVNTNCNSEDAIAAGQSASEYNLQPYVASTAGPTVAIVGASCSTASQSLSWLMNYRHIPIVSYGSTSPSLSDKFKHPWFVRTVPPLIPLMWSLSL